VLRVPRQVLVYLYRLHDGSLEFLVLKRTKEWGGFWQGVSGAPEPGETDKRGAIREVHEETGFSVASSLQPIDFRYELLREEDPDKERWEHVYGPEVRAIPEEVYVANVPDNRDPTLSPYEHDTYRWCSFKEASELLTWENNRRALKAAREFIAASTACDDLLLGEEGVSQDLA
jgi:8-oxo-dGTP pyrophosphatase MutT (NUDIX family)